jgi:hypothetical protein
MMLEPLETLQDDGVSVAAKYVLESAQFLVGISENFDYLGCFCFHLQTN